MASRRFEAATLLEAVRAVRVVLGPDAVVISARRIPASRWPWGRREPRFRIVAEPSVLPPRSGQGEPWAAALLEKMGRLADELAELRRAVEGLERSGTGPRGPALRPRTVRAVRNPSATPGSVDAWSRESSSS